MIPWEDIDQAKVPGGGDIITLRRRGTEFSIRTPGIELMNSRVHGSEEALAELTFTHITPRSGLRILMGGLGMGFTLAAALQQSTPDTHITVCELIPAVVRWNRYYLGHLAGMPLEDSRVSVQEEDVAALIGKRKRFWDAIMLDVDNGPDGLTQKSNDRLYSRFGLDMAFSALRPRGILGVWSCGPDPGFTQRLNQCGFKTQIIPLKARKSQKGSRHIIWLARKP